MSDQCDSSAVSHKSMLFLVHKFLADSSQIHTVEYNCIV